MISSDDEDREYPRHPLVGVGAIVLRDGAVLLVRRAKEPNKGRWSIPGGLVELGEGIRDAVRREVREECGVIVDPRTLFEVIDAVHPDEDGRTRFHYVIVDFLSEWLNGEPKAGSDVADARWVPFRELQDIDMTDSARVVVEKAIARFGE